MFLRSLRKKLSPADFMAGVRPSPFLTQKDFQMPEEWELPEDPDLLQGLWAGS